jgi:nucleotide-binding universal stress UspA family protein
MKLKKILGPMDFSEGSKEALRYALMLQEQYQSHLILLHVLSRAFETYTVAEGQVPGQRFVPTPGGGVLLYPDPSGKQIRRDLVEEAHWKIKDLVPVAQKERFQSEIRIGDPADEILKVAKEEGVDLIVMGTHGRTGLPHLWMGSVAERVVRLSPVPVLTIRPLAKAS